ncbi:MAG TPA: hypothetical protein VFB54_01865 [Burkholderiales bacterium]|nr:hypothetical protein [Burkholderiales bacterium]
MQRELSVVFRHCSARYQIDVANPRGVSREMASVELDGQRLRRGHSRIARVDDARVRSVRLVLG